MKYFVYELHLRESPFQANFYGYLIFNRDNDSIVSIIKRETMREARARCNQILNIASQYDDTMIVWRNWPIIITRQDTEEDIIQKIKEREI